MWFREWSSDDPLCLVLKRQVSILTVYICFFLKVRVERWGYFFFENCRNSNVCENIGKLCNMSRNFPLEVVRFFFHQRWTLDLNDKNSRNPNTTSLSNPDTKNLIKWRKEIVRRVLWREEFNFHDHGGSNHIFLMFIQTFQFLQFSREKYPYSLTHCLMWNYHWRK